MKGPARMFPSYSYPLISDGQGVVGLTRGQMDLAPEHPVPSGAVTTKPFIEQVLPHHLAGTLSLKEQVPFIQLVPPRDCKGISQQNCYSEFTSTILGPP